MFMRYLLLAMVFVFCSCREPSKPLKSIFYPDKNLKVISIWGWYKPHTKNKYYYRDLKEIKILNEEMFDSIGEEFCYNKEKNKEAILNKNLRARLYDKEGKMLSEDFLRIESKGNDLKVGVVSYLPYHDEGDSILIVRLDGIKEIVLRNLVFYSQAELRKISEKTNHQTNTFPRTFWIFDEEKECHSSPEPSSIASR